MIISGIIIALSILIAAGVSGCLSEGGKAPGRFIGAEGEFRSRSANKSDLSGGY